MTRNQCTSLRHAASRTIAALLLCLVCGMAWGSGNKWPTTRFVVIHSAPPTNLQIGHEWQPVRELIDSVLVDIGLNASTAKKRVTDIEDYLQKVALEYERMGFRAPRLRLHQGAYVVYLYDYDGPPKAGACNRQKNSFGNMVDFDSTIHIPLATLDDRRHPGGDPRLKEHLAHELFHTIQYQYTMCAHQKDPGNFFIEGAAQAIGHDVTYYLTGEEIERKSTSRWGERDYVRPLHQPVNRSDSYNISSFWRYIAEHIAHGHRGGRADVYEYKDVRPDYRYLHTLMTYWDGKGNDSVEVMRWLHNGLQAETRLDLARLFPQFIATFSGFGGEDAEDGRGKARYPGMSKGRTHSALGNCKPLHLQDISIGSSANTFAQTSLRIENMAATCVEVVLTGGQSEVPLTLHVRAANSTQADQLWIGPKGGPAIKRPPTPTQAAPIGGGYISTWQFRVRPGTQTFALVNAVDQPWTGRAMDLEITAIVPAFEHSMMPSVPDAAPGRQTPRAPRPEADGGSRDRILEEATARMEDALEGRRFVRGVGFDHRPDGRCNGDHQPFLYRACGPTTTIHMGIGPDVQLLHEGGGGFMGQTIADVNAMHDVLVRPDATMKLGQQIKRIEEQDGHGLTLTLPKIDHGFSGNLPALIEVRSGGNEIYRTVAPHSDRPGHRITGQVSIEEYTPLVMRGQFSGLLVGRPVPESDPLRLTVIGNISGRFTAASPLHEVAPADDSIKRRVLDNFMQDVFQGVPGISPDIRSVMQTIFDQQIDTHASKPDAGNSGAGGTGGSPRPDSPLQPFRNCDCTCGRAIDDGCAAVCSVRETACPLLAMRPTEASLARASTWRSALVEHLSARNTSARLRDFYLSEFDNAKDDAARQLLLRSLDIPVEP